MVELHRFVARDHRRELLDQLLQAQAALARRRVRTQGKGLRVALLGIPIMFLVVCAARRAQLADGLPFLVPYAYESQGRLPRHLKVSRTAFDLGTAIGGFFADEKDKFEVPKDVSALVEGLKKSTENTLNRAISRLDVEVPPAYQLGVEGEKKKGRLLDDKIKSDNLLEIARGDRELARIFIEMLQPVGQGLVVAFRTKSLANAAKKTWKLEPSEASIISFPGKAKTAFAAEVGAPTVFRRTLRELNCQCLLVVAPYLDELRLVNELSNDIQDNMGIVLLNSRIHGIGRQTIKIPSRLRQELQQTFPPSYHVRFLGRKNGILFHMSGEEGPSPWVLAQQRELIGGQPLSSEVSRFAKEPTEEQIEEAFAAFDARERGAADKLLDLVDKDKISR